MSPPVLRLDALTLELGGTAVVHELDLVVQEPGWLGLLGPNGSGKTTLLRALAGRLPISSGRVLIGGADVSADPAARANLTGFASETAALPPEVTGEELFALIGDARGASAPGEPRAVYAALDLSEIAPILIGAMSSGMRQRVSVFAAFIGAPRVVLLDEPLNWLDLVAARRLKAAIREVADAGTLVVTSIHEPAMLPAWCDAGLLLRGGRTLRSYTAADLAGRRTDVLLFEGEVFDLFTGERS